MGNQEPATVGPTPLPEPLKRRWSGLDYLWFIIKNILGWMLILLAWPIGVMIPGPGGIPLFLIGFALITFPGKRRLTARVLRGRPVHPESQAYRLGVKVLAVVVPAGFLSWLFNKWLPFLQESFYKSLLMALGYLAAVAAIWVFGVRGVHLVNWMLAVISRGRRRVRPWMRGKGLDLLPPRRRWRRRRHGQHEPDEEILEIHERHHDRLRWLWQVSRPWLVRAVRIGFVAAAFYWMLRPVMRHWHEPGVQARISAVNWWQFAAAAGMFSVFLFVFRVLAWRRILGGLGHWLPVSTSARIWSMSELARYMPGGIWQVVGRVYLTRPYGIGGGVSSASQLLELALFMLANVLVALGCLLGAGYWLIPTGERYWMWLAVALAPALLALLHPRVFFGALNGVLRRLHRPELERRLPKRELALVAAWNALGLLWQSLAIWLLTRSTLGLPIEKWYLLAGAYCLAWTMGFSVGFLSPGGMGVRELVFVTTLRYLLPAAWVSAQFQDAAVFVAVVGFMGVLLRLWAICGELMMAGAALLADRINATGRQGAGRVATVKAPGNGAC